MTTADYVVEVLGGAAVFRGKRMPTSSEWHDQVKRGLPYRSLEAVRKRLGLTAADAADVLHLPARTLARRRQAGRLAADESDRLYRLARVAAYAVAVFQDEDKAATWLQRPNRALGGETPVRRLGTDAGARQVEEVLGRLEHGVIG